MLFAVYCPCKVKELGLEVLGTQSFGIKTWHYIVFLSIIEKREIYGQDYSKCQHCAAFLRIVGADRAADKEAGITRKIAQRGFEEYARCEEEDKALAETSKEEAKP